MFQLQIGEKIFFFKTLQLKFMINYLMFFNSSSFRDLDQACMEAVGALLRGLPLQPEESDRGDLMEAKSQLFLKYFTLFMNLLNNCNDVAAEEKEEVSRQRITSGKLSTLRNATIQAMSNLLSANIDSGLMHSIGMLLLFISIVK